MHENNCFITLTYSDEHLPSDGKLRYLDFQLFMKRLRKQFGPDIGFFMCGEYGDQTKRPHYHACLFGIDFEDKTFVRENEHGDKIWNSQSLTDLWSLGHTELGSVTQKSAGYVARYVLKKKTLKMTRFKRCRQKMLSENGSSKNTGATFSSMHVVPLSYLMEVRAKSQGTMKNGSEKIPLKKHGYVTLNP